MVKTDDTSDEFAGAKLILFLGPRILVLRRDRRDDIPWPGYLDLPGGGREGDESPEACALRETHEETGLILRAPRIIWRNRAMGRAGPVWFLATRIPAARAADVALGDEGISWRLMPPDDFAKHPEAIPHFRDEVRLCLAATPVWEAGP